MMNEHAPKIGARDGQLAINQSEPRETNCRIILSFSLGFSNLSLLF